MTVLSVILASVFFLVTAAKLVNKLQFRNMKVSAFVFRKEAKKKKNWVAPHYGELYVGCCSLTKRTLLQHGNTPVHFTV